MPKYIIRSNIFLIATFVLLGSFNSTAIAQISVSYMVNATVDYDARTIKGAVEIKLKNNSDSTIADIVLRADLNAYQSGTELNSLESVINDSPLSFGDSTQVGYCRIDSIMWHGSPVTQIDSLFNNSLFRIPLEMPIASGVEEYFYIAFESRIPELLSDSSSLILAHPFPVLATRVKNHWCDKPYQGNGEDYLNLSDFSMSITIDTGYTLVHPGELLNEKLHFGILPKIAEGEVLPDITGLLGESPAINKVVIPSTEKTYLIKAQNLNRPTMVVMKNAVIDRAAVEGVLISVYYPESDFSGWYEQVARMASVVVDSLKKSGHKFKYDELKIVKTNTIGARYSSNQLRLHDEKTGDNTAIRFSLIEFLSKSWSMNFADTTNSQEDNRR